MSPEKRPEVDLSEVLTEIDNRSFINFVFEVASEVSPGFGKEEADAILIAVRCACLLDLHAETDNPEYLEEFDKQRVVFYGLISEDRHEKLISLELEVVRFFENERVLMGRIRKGESFSEEDIRKHLLGKSSDNLFYGQVLEILVPRWNLTRQLRAQTILFDIGKDIEDYSEDVEGGLPNVLYMALSADLEHGQMPRESDQALLVARKTGASEMLLRIASEFRDKALESEGIKTSPTLRRAVVDRFEELSQLLT